MTKSRPVERRNYTPEERMRAVEAFNNRGDKTAAQLADELGVNAAMLYHWAARVERGESLENKPRGRAVAKAKAAALAKHKPAPGAIVASTSNGKHKPAPQQIALTFDRDLEYENRQLRAENARLKRAIRAVLLDDVS